MTPQPHEQHLPAQHQIQSGGALGGAFEDPVNWDIPEQAHDQPEQETPTKRGRPCGSKNRPGTWKDTAAPAWKPPAHTQISIDNPEAIAHRTRSRQGHVDSILQQEFCSEKLPQLNQLTR